jgi:hypothetical protein
MGCLSHSRLRGIGGRVLLKIRQLVVVHIGCGRGQMRHHRLTPAAWQVNTVRLQNISEDTCRTAVNCDRGTATQRWHLHFRAIRHELKTTEVYRLNHASHCIAPSSKSKLCPWHL